MKKVIITGCGGFIGGALTKILLEQGLTVFGVDIAKKQLERFNCFNNFVPVIADFSKYDRIDELIVDRGFDYLIHTAWSVSGGKGYLNNYYDYTLQNENVQAACIIADKCKALEVKRLVFCNSSYQSMTVEGFNEPINYYGIAKKSASEYCLAICKRSGVECNIATLTNTYGVGDVSKKAVNNFISKLLNHEKLSLVDGTRKNDWMYIDDTVNGLIAVAESPYSFKYYYVGHKEITTFKEKLLQMKDILGSRSELLFGAYTDETFVDYEQLDAAQLNIDTGFKCKADFKESILKTAEWVKSLN